MPSSEDNGLGTLIIVGALIVTVAYCNRGGSRGTSKDLSEPSAYIVSGYGSEDDETSSEDETAVDEEVALERAAEDAPYSYLDAGQPYGCTEDCSGHEAGYKWAIDNGVNDPSLCGGNSQSFEEGCRAYGDTIVERAEEIMEEVG